jgi:hypothetical protein
VGWPETRWLDRFEFVKRPAGATTRQNPVDPPGRPMTRATGQIRTRPGVLKLDPLEMIAICKSIWVWSSWCLSLLCFKTGSNTSFCGGSTSLCQMFIHPLLHRAMIKSGESGTKGFLLPSGSSPSPWLSSSSFFYLDWNWIWTSLDPKSAPLSGIDV